MDTLAFFAELSWLEERFRTSEDLIPKMDLISVRHSMCFFFVFLIIETFHFSFKISYNIATFFFGVSCIVSHGLSIVREHFVLKKQTEND